MAHVHFKESTQEQSRENVLAYISVHKVCVSVQERLVCFCCYVNE